VRAGCVQVRARLNGIKSLANVSDKELTRLFRRWTGPKSAAAEAAEGLKDLVSAPHQNRFAWQKIRSVILPTASGRSGYFAPR
jgi:hypothetical protein